MPRIKAATTTQTAPLMVHFLGTQQEMPGLTAWGGKTLHMEQIRKLDLALQLGAPRPWVETMIEEVLDSGSQRVVLVNPDYGLFMGDAEANRERVFQAMAEAKITLSELKTHSVRPPFSGRLWGRTA